MYRTMICVLLAGCLCFGLCGCGAMDQPMDDPVVETPLLPKTTADLHPMPDVIETPDVDDGIVRDEDGKIEPHDTGTPAPNASPAPSAKPERPSPEPNRIP